MGYGAQNARVHCEGACTHRAQQQQQPHLSCAQQPSPLSSQLTDKNCRGIIWLMWPHLLQSPSIFLKQLSRTLLTLLRITFFIISRSHNVIFFSRPFCNIKQNELSWLNWELLPWKITLLYVVYLEIFFPLYFLTFGFEEGFKKHLRPPYIFTLEMTYSHKR